MEQTVPTAKGPQVFRTIQFTQGNNANNDQTTKQARAIMQNMQAEQAQIQYSMQKMYNDYYRNMKALLVTDPAAFANFGMPFMPVIVVTPASQTILPTKP